MKNLKYNNRNSENLDEKENVFEKLIAELSYEEKMTLKSKLENILNISNQSEIKKIEKNNERQLEKYIKEYKITWFQKMLFYIISIFRSISYKDFILNKIQDELKSKLSKSKPHFYKKNTDTITIIFYNYVSDLNSFYYKYSSLIEYFKNVFKNEDENKKFIFYIFKNNLDNVLKKKFEFFKRENLKEFILKEKEYKIKLTDFKKVFEKEVSFTLKEKIQKIYNFIYSFFNFFEIGFDNFFDIVKRAKSPENVKVNSISFFLIKFYKAVNSIPVENLEYLDKLIHSLNFVNFKDIKIDIDIDKEDFIEFFKTIAKLQSSKSLEYLLKIALNNPVARYPSFRYNMEIKKMFYSYFDKYVKDVIFDLENEIRIEKKQSIYRQLEEIGFEFYNLKHLNKEFINFLKKYSLPTLNNFESFQIITSFYYTVWQKELRNQMQNIIAFKYYVLPQKNINKLNDLFIDIDNFDFELNNIDNEVQKLKINISQSFKNVEKLADKSLLGIINAEISKIDILIDNFNKNFHEKIKEVAIVLNYNRNDTDITNFLSRIEWWENIFRILFF